MGRRKASVELNEQHAVNEEETRRSTRKRTVVKYTEKEENTDEPVVKKGKGKKKNVNDSVNEKAKSEIKIEIKEEDTDAGPSISKANISTKGKRGSKKVSSTEGKRGSKKVSETKIKEEPEESSILENPGGKEGEKKSIKKKASGKENSDNNIPPKAKTKSGVDRILVAGKGRAPVDGICPIAKTSHVFEEGDDIWDCMLNQTNIQFNNNKYYLIQLLKDDDKNSYSVWMRWGRVGANGQNALTPCGGDLDKAKKIFMKKFSDKTRNDWDERRDFEKVQGKYDLVAIDYSKGDDTTDSTLSDRKKIREQMKKVECKLEPRVKSLVEFLCDIRIMEAAVLEMKYDASKAPLGKLTKEQIKAGYIALKKIDNILMEGKYNNRDFLPHCNDFYTRIPHVFGMKVPDMIRTKEQVREKIALLEVLGDIQAALSIMDQPIDVNVHPVDQHYTGLKCDITPLDKESQDFKLLERYMSSTHGKTHTGYKMELLEVFEVKKETEYDRFKNVGNNMLLWHGSRNSNWAGILSQGLRIAPPEAPVTGYMFGKGIYFADMASKSANYCWATQRNDVGFLVLSEVALGQMNELLHADYEANKLPKGCHSVKGCGRHAPIPENFHKLSDGTVIPMGPCIDTNVSNQKGYTLLYNEYIVYDPAQVRLRFMLKIKFNFR